MEQLEGRVAVVTGAASGIGFAVAEALATEGTRVLLTDLDGEAVAAQASELADRGHEVDARPLDVRDPDAAEEVADHAVERFGALHVAVLSAGIVNGGTSWELSLDDWHAILDVNLWGVVHGVRSFVPRILASGAEGHVVAIASMAAVLALGGLGPYTVAKHGVLGLSDVLRADLEAAGAPVGVSVVLPGSIKTAMNPIGTIEPSTVDRRPSTVAANVVDGIRRSRPYAFTDQQATRSVAARLGAIMESRADMVDPPT